MATRIGAPLAAVAATVAATAALLAAAPAPATAVATLRAAAASPDPMGPLLALVALVAWSLAAWLVLIAAGSLAARLPGGCGRVAGAALSHVAPAGLRRRVEVALGLAVAAGVLGAGPASASPAIPPAPPGVIASLDWPAAAEPPALDWNPARAAVAHAAAAPSQPPGSAPRDAVVVQPGDSLWAIAADHLPAHVSPALIAAAWPAWWSSNRDAIGADPDLIHPGLVLHPPRPS
jgi:hypothetical protein